MEPDRTLRAALIVIVATCVIGLLGTAIIGASAPTSKRQAKTQKLPQYLVVSTSDRHITMAQAHELNQRLALMGVTAVPDLSPQAYDTLNAFNVPNFEQSFSYLGGLQGKMSTSDGLGTLYVLAESPSYGNGGDCTGSAATCASVTQALFNLQLLTPTDGPAWIDGCQMMFGVDCDNLSAQQQRAIDPTMLQLLEGMAFAVNGRNSPAERALSEYAQIVVGCNSVHLVAAALPDAVDTWACSDLPESDAAVWAATLPAGWSGCSAAAGVYDAGRPVVYGSNWILDLDSVTTLHATQIAAQLGASLYTGGSACPN